MSTQLPFKATKSFLQAFQTGLPKLIFARSLSGAQFSRATTGFSSLATFQIQRKWLSTTQNVNKKQNSKTLPQQRGISFKKFNLIPQPPGDVIGTVNQAYVHPPPDPYHGSYHWTYDRFVGAALVPLTIAPFVANVDMPLIDSLFCTFVLLHSKVGFQSCIIDYIPKRRYGVWHTYAMRLLTFGTVVAFYGVYQLETEGPGIFEMSSQVWKALSV